jgi:hypothetical protein
LVYPIPHTADSTEEVIQEMIEGAQRMIRINYNSPQEQEPEIRINPAIKRDCELVIERDIAKCSKRDEDKLRELLKLKERENEQATHIEETQRLVT